MELQLNHLNLPSRDPEALRQWYMDKLGFRRHGRFLWSGGSLLVFVDGEPINRKEPHFGFLVESLEELHRWADKLGESVEGDESYSTFFTADPEGNRFEIFYEVPPA